MGTILNRLGQYLQLIETVIFLLTNTVTERQLLFCGLEGKQRAISDSRTFPFQLTMTRGEARRESRRGRMA